jgi:hypothetical protein
MSVQMSKLESVPANHENAPNGNGQFNRKNTTKKNGQNKECDRLRKEIDLIDKWSNYGANNGLFNGENGNSSSNVTMEDGEKAYKSIHDHLKQAKDDLDEHNYSDCTRDTSLARLSYLKILYSKPWRWRFVNLYAGPVWIYLATFLALVMAFYIYFVDEYFQNITGIDQAAIHAVTWGCLGSVLRGMWYLKDKVSEREYKNSWWIYFISTPFLGGIFGAIIYLVLIAGLLSLGVEQSSNEETLQINRPLVIVPIAALAGFNWEWAVNMFKRIGDLFTPSSDSNK